MLDENLPTFYLSPNPDGIKHHKSLFLSQYGSDAEPAYSLHYLDPSSPTAANRYAVALLDSHNPNIVYGEILVHPDWANPTLSVDEIHRNGGVPPPPQPQLPGRITIQLYNPDQSIVVTQKAGSWGASPTYEFSMPSITFRTPSASVLDRSQNDPSADVSTPRLHFSWKKEGKLSKDFSCAMVGKSTDVAVKKKKKGKDPDIAVALFRSAKEITLYESNMSRVEIEDSKGLELVLLLGAIAIRDVYLGPTKEVFHIAANPRRDSNSRKTPPLTNDGLSHQRQRAQVPASSHLQQPGRPGLSSSAAGVAATAVPLPASGQLHASPHQKLPSRTAHNVSPQPPHITQGAQANANIPSTDPRKQPATDAEAARLRAQVERQRKEQAKTEESDRRRAKKIAEHEAKEQQRRQAEIDRETERLRKKYGVGQQQQGQAVRPSGSPAPAQPVRKTAGVQQNSQYLQPHRPPQNENSFLQHQQRRRHSSNPVSSQRPYLQPIPAHSAAHFHSPPRPSPDHRHHHQHHHGSHNDNHHHHHHHHKQHHHSNHQHKKPAGNSPYLQVPGSGGTANASLSTFFNKLSDAANSSVHSGHHNLGAPRKSLFGLRSTSDEHAGRLSKKRSSIF